MKLYSLSVLVVALATVSLAQVPKPCDTPKEWQGYISQRTPHLDDALYAYVSYDEVGQRILAKEEIHHHGKKYIRSNLYLFKEKLMYKVNETTGACEVHDLTTEFEPFAVPDSVSFVTARIIGLAGTPREAITVYDFIGDVRGAFWSGTVTYPSCAPVSMTTYDPKHGYTYTEFYDISPGIANPMVFFPPRNCLNASVAHPKPSGTSDRLFYHRYLTASDGYSKIQQTIHKVGRIVKSAIHSLTQLAKDWVPLIKKMVTERLRRDYPAVLNYLNKHLKMNKHFTAVSTFLTDRSNLQRAVQHVRRSFQWVIRSLRHVANRTYMVLRSSAAKRLQKDVVDILYFVNKQLRLGDYSKVLSAMLPDPSKLKRSLHDITLKSVIRSATNLAGRIYRIPRSTAARKLYKKASDALRFVDNRLSIRKKARKFAVYITDYSKVQRTFKVVSSSIHSAIRRLVRVAIKYYSAVNRFSSQHFNVDLSRTWHVVDARLGISKHLSVFPVIFNELSQVQRSIHTIVISVKSIFQPLAKVADNRWYHRVAKRIVPERFRIGVPSPLELLKKHASLSKGVNIFSFVLNNYNKVQRSVDTISRAVQSTMRPFGTIVNHKWSQKVQSVFSKHINVDLARVRGFLDGLATRSESYNAISAIYTELVKIHTSFRKIRSSIMSEIKPAAKVVHKLYRVMKKTIVHPFNKHVPSAMKFVKSTILPYTEVMHKYYKKHAPSAMKFVKSTILPYTEVIHKYYKKHAPSAMKFVKSTIRPYTEVMHTYYNIMKDAIVYRIRMDLSKMFARQINLQKEDWHKFVDNMLIGRI